MKLHTISKWIIGIVAVLGLLLIVCYVRLNNNEDINTVSKPDDENEPSKKVITLETASSDSSLPSQYELMADKEEVPDIYHGSITPIEEYDREEPPRIVCWGDSLTESCGDNTSYPDVLREITGVTVENFGLSSDNTRQIAVRCGAIPVYVSACTIPAGTQPVEVSLSSPDTNVKYMLHYGDNGVNPCMIGNVEGTLYEEDDVFTFKRSKSGKATEVADNTQLKTYGDITGSSDDILILFSGANDGLSKDNVLQLVETQKQIIDYLGTEDYIVIGPTYAESASDLVEINQALLNEYNEHFLNAHEYFVNFGLNDSKLPVTDTDRKDMASDYIPDSLRTDYVHGKPIFYQLLAEQVYRKLMYLGYLPLQEEYSALFDNSETDVNDEYLNEPEPVISGERVVCWGDSFTEGTMGDGVTFPDVIERSATEDDKDVEVLNYGVYAEESSLIAARSGGNTMRLRDSVTIPADCTPVEVVPKSEMNGYEMLLVFGGDKELSARGNAFIGDNSINPCIIGGVEGNLSIDPATGTRYFTRLKPGKSVVANTSDPIRFWAMRNKRKDDILVIWSGTNDKPDHNSITRTMEYIDSIIRYTGSDRYVVINMTKIEDIPEIEQVNAIMAAKYGRHIIDLRSYLLNDALSDAGISPTEEDKEFIAAGRVPRSLYAEDITHYTGKGYELIGKFIYKKLCKLGYL